jgi:hypothetical protein
MEPNLPKPCGDCGMCCKLLKIEPLNKPAGAWCQHFANGRGCTIYNDRPPVCRNFQCLWTMRNDLGDGWRPDQAKFMMSFGDGQLFILTDPRFPHAWRKEPYYSQIRSWSYRSASPFKMVVVHVNERALVVFPEAEVDLGPYRGNTAIVTGYRSKDGRNFPYAYYDAPDAPEPVVTLTPR